MATATATATATVMTMVTATATATAMATVTGMVKVAGVMICHIATLMVELATLATQVQHATTEQKGIRTRLPWTTGRGVATDTVGIIIDSGGRRQIAIKSLT